VGLLLATRTDSTLQALRQVRDPHLFKWYAVTLLALVIYVYANEVERGRWDVIAAGVAVWWADWFNEIINALVLQASNRAALWTLPPRGRRLPLGVLVVEHAVRAADYPVRLPLVLPLRGVGVRRSHGPQALDATRRPRSRRSRRGPRVRRRVRLAVAPSARPGRLGAERIMSGVVKLGRYVSACVVTAALLAGCGGSGDGVTLTSSTAGPTTCTVYEPGGATQVIFASARLDVRAECEAWISRDIGAGYLWGDEPSSAVAQTPGARQVCYVKDLRGPLTASVIEDTGYRPPSALARAKGTSACADLLATSRASR